ncbi:MAG: TRAP transporter large permease subunit [Spirochaetales bacterium]|jgi:tripartite ATP-independent transporter DctM subunit|nr:TRAP transporter large permease subunit [Spirochaetales bacterium]
MLIVFLVFVVLLFIGLPVGFSVLIAGAMFFFQHSDTLLTTIVQLPITQTQNVNLLAVPLFIFAGNLMNCSGITERLVKLAMALTGHMRGGLAQVSVVLSTLMGGVSGSANADAAMEARILGGDMLRQGYPKGYTSCVIAFTSLITATIPPGVSMIMYGTVGNISIGKLFTAGLTVGVVMMILYMLLVAVTSRIYGFKPVREKRLPLRDILRIARETIWAVIFPVLLLVGIRFGLFTPSEVGAFACVYALFIGIFIYKEISLKKLIQTFEQSVVDIGAIMFMISMSAVFGYGIPIDKLPQKVTVLIAGLTSNPYAVMALVVVFLIIAGMFMEGSIIILLTTPILLPLMSSFGIDPIVFGLILCTVVTMGNMTPPVGLAMYTVCGILNCPLEDYVKACLPFVLIVLIEEAVLTLFPKLVLFLPDLLY